VSSSTRARNRVSLVRRESALRGMCLFADDSGNAGYNVSKAAVKTFTEQRELVDIRRSGRVWLMSSRS